MSLNFGPTNPRIQGCESLDTIRLSQKDNKFMFIILYKHYMPKNLELKNPSVEIKSWDLINYWAFCCQIHLGTVVFVLIMDECFIKLEIEQ